LLNPEKQETTSTKYRQLAIGHNCHTTNYAIQKILNLKPLLSTGKHLLRNISYFILYSIRQRHGYFERLKFRI
ncbi:MAG: hypothetical protein LBT05_07355, partial [Planctomycetaceae bacterium]|nr:hypothetical protein [Planctomycetaceae bacterium]